MPGHPPPESELGRTLARNIRDLSEARAEFARRRTGQERVADAIARFSGTMAFAYAHAALLVAWVVVNLGLLAPLGVRPFDPFPFGLLAAIVSVEAVFLTSFVLINQNRMAALDARRAELSVQVDLLAEHEVTRAVRLADAIARRLDVPVARPDDLEEAKRDVDPTAVLAALERASDDGPPDPRP